MTFENKRPVVGTAIIIIKNGLVLLGKRKAGLGVGTWSVPGGHLEQFETIEDCVRREVREEVGIEVGSIVKLGYTEDIFLEEKGHSITCWVKTMYSSGEIENKEPEKCEGWQWFDWNKLPTPLFQTNKNFLKLAIDPRK